MTRTKSRVTSLRFAESYGLPLGVPMGYFGYAVGIYCRGNPVLVAKLNENKIRKILFKLIQI